MGLQLIINAATPAQLEPVWRALGGATATVEIIGDLMGIQVDLTSEREPVQDLVDDQIRRAVANAGHVPIDPDPDPELAPIPTDDDLDDHGGDIAESAPDAQVVAIDRKARTEHPTGKVQRDTAADRVLAVLASDPTSTFTPADVAEELPDMPYGTLTGQLATLVRSGKVRRRGRGEYQAVPAS